MLLLLTLVHVGAASQGASSAAASMRSSKLLDTPLRRAGLKAGLSHGPIQDDKERYVFFSFPHIAIAPRGKIGGVARPGREAESTACGAMIATLGSFQDDPKQLDTFREGEHEPTDIELTILKQRLAARIAQACPCCQQGC